MPQGDGRFSDEIRPPPNGMGLEDDVQPVMWPEETRKSSSFHVEFVLEELWQRDFDEKPLLEPASLNPWNQRRWCF